MKPFMDSPELNSLLQKLPYLRHLMDTHGDMSLFDYGKAHYRWAQKNDVLFLERKTEFLGILSEYVSWKFGDTLAHTVVKSLRENYAVSTAEHHGPLGHPFFFQSAILRGLVNPDEAIVNLCTSHVSLGNSSYPRGLVFHGDGTSAPEEYLHLPFFSARKRMSPVFGLWSYTEEDIKKSTCPRIHAYLDERIITEETWARLMDFLKNVVLDKTVLKAWNYSAQITLLNHRWWGEMFPEFPEYVPLDAEDIVREILIKHIEKNTVTAQLVTDEKIQPMIEEYFDGISCCFERKNKKWTYLFWHLDEEKNRHALWREGGELVSVDGSFRVQLNSSSLLLTLRSWVLIPSGLLVYTTLSCYYGLTCFWGFSQGDYLPQIQQAYRNILKHIDWALVYAGEEAAILNEDMVFLHENSGQISSALDLSIHGAQNREEMLSLTQKVTIKKSIEHMREEILRCL